MAPSVFLIRHGQTEWSKVGKYTGITDIELTDTGKKEAMALGDSFVGPNKLIDPSSLVHIFVSPRNRARETFELVTEQHPELRQRATFTEDLREWDHGDYEGLTTQQIRDVRVENGLDLSSEWSIWAGGCEGGESVQDIERRAKDVISSIRDIQKDYIDDENGGNVMLVGHGTFLRCLWKVWAHLPVDSPINIQFDTGSVATLSYKDNNINSRTAIIGLKMSSSS
ncbi:histidine phosphatase superfamily clade-1 [Fusarium mundagurra]|uniref:Histidine phosphatase superfamily clade-1 n=1 Tax=Fusarium mundagurra TaxID=1567541 RepID=A0A8H6DER4_9HYPO|nr:histidine phosphatase superfamily clade-1 [Fusarium mundagurra]